MNINNYSPVKDMPNLKKDGGAVITTDNEALSAYKRQRKMQLDQKNQIAQYENDINTIRTEVNELKDLLKKFLNNDKG